ncbi:MAG: LCP family protein [Erysipelotrichales bacterium]|nr:LCP family protein [Erysipelotrichales bacterium]
MKILLKKFKKTKLSIRLIYIFVLLLFLVSYVFLFRSLLLLNNVETVLRIIVLTILGLLLLLYSFFDLLLLLSKKHKIVVISSLIILVISSFSMIGSLAINKVYGLLASISKETVIYTTNLISLNSSEFINDGTFSVGIINNETDIEGNILAYELIDKEKLNVKIEKYDTYFELLEKLYNGEVNGIFITSNYAAMYESYDAYENIASDVKVLFDYSKEMKNQDYIESNASVENPFTVLIMGVDSQYDGLNANAAFNGDTLMIISFNPHTLNATVFSIPRDTYVPIACLKNESSKINSSAAYGTKCVINTVENLVDINIDYYVKINFKGVVDLVNTLGGIDVTVPDGIKFCEQDSNRSHAAEVLQCIESGYQHMDGEKALAFARHRKTLPAGDFQRVQHQQLVVEGIANSAKNLKSINDFYAVLDAISRNMDTNMTTKEMMNLYNVGKSVIFGANKGSLINIQKTYLTGYDLTMYVNNLRGNVYTFQYYEQSLEEIKDALKITLETKKATPTKTFNFSVNDEYEPVIVGKKYYTVQRNETIPNFHGQTLQYAKSWCEARNITVYINYITPGATGYDDTLANETVVNQSVARGRLTKDVSHITIDIISKPTSVVENITTTPVTSEGENTEQTTTTERVEEGPAENIEE